MRPSRRWHLFAFAGVTFALWSGAQPRLSAEPEAGLRGLAVGTPMEDFGLRELDVPSGTLKRTVWLSDYVGPKTPRDTRKKLVLLNFFASWCKPCRAELPALSLMQSKYADSGLQVLSVNFRRSGETIDAAITATQDLLSTQSLSFPILFDRYTKRAQLIYAGSQAVLPCNVTIDASGRVVGRFEGGDAAQLARLETQIRLQLGLAGDAEAP